MTKRLCKCGTCSEAAAEGVAFVAALIKMGHCPVFAAQVLESAQVAVAGLLFEAVMNRRSPKNGASKLAHLLLTESVINEVGEIGRNASIAMDKEWDASGSLFHDQLRSTIKAKQELNNTADVDAAAEAQHPTVLTFSSLDELFKHLSSKYDPDLAASVISTVTGEQSKSRKH